MRFFRIISAAILFSASAAVLFAQDEPSVVAKVNGTEIDSFEVRREMNMMYQRAVQQGVYPDNSQIDEFWNTALQTLIGRELLVQEAIKNDYKADQDYVDEYIGALTKNYGGPDALNEALSSQGMTLEKLRSDTERYQIVSKFVDAELWPLVNVTEQEASDYYQKNKEHFTEEEKVDASHILIAVAQDASEEEAAAALEKIKGIREQLVAGADFGELAKKYSEGPSAEKGGELGEFGHGSMVPPFDKAVFALEPGEISEPVRTQFGYHLIKLNSKSGGGIIGFDEIKSQIMDYLANMELDKEVNTYVDDLRKGSEIIIF